MLRLSRSVDSATEAVVARPWIWLAAVLGVTLLLGGGLLLRAPQTETGAYLPSDSDAARAAQTIDELFGGSSDVVLTTIIFRGDALSPAGLAQMDELLDRVASDPGVAETLTTDNAIVAPTLVIGGVLGVDGFDSVTQAEINSAIEQLLTDPGLVRLDTALSEITGADSDGTFISVATIRLRDTGDDLVRQAQLKIHELAVGLTGTVAGGNGVSRPDRAGVPEGHGSGLRPADGPGHIGGLGTDPVVHAFGAGLAIGPPGPGAGFGVDPRSRRLVGAGSTGSHRPTQCFRRHGADHSHRTGRGLPHPVALPLPGAADRWEAGRGSDAGRIAEGDHPGGTGGRHDHGEPSQQSAVAHHAGAGFRSGGRIGSGVRFCGDADIRPCGPHHHRSAQGTSVAFSAPPVPSPIRSPASVGRHGCWV